MLRSLQNIVTLCVVLSLASCGYSFQATKNPLRELGIEKIFVVGFTNHSFRPGIEQMFTTAMVREIQKSGAFRLVDSEKDADAILTGEITSADSPVSSTKTTKIGASKEVEAAVQYLASIVCAVKITDRAKRDIFSQSISSSKIYPGAVRTGASGATVPLVNESEQRLAIQFLSTQMMASIYQRIVDPF